MSDQDDWDFAGPDDAKAEISGLQSRIFFAEFLAAHAVISLERSLRPCAT
jgi:hypothetical protein